MKRRGSSGRGRRRDRLIQERDHDPYRARRKPAEPTACPSCGAVFREGRWRWGAAPTGAHRDTCPACQRIRDGYPAGYVTLEGPFARAHRDEILSLARHVEAREKQTHPLQRIVATRADGEGLVVTTTDLHLARAIGDSVYAAYGGELEVHYAPEQPLARVRWWR
jgi:NMD protein affecting ribosome stability and mRNA decay